MRLILSLASLLVLSTNMAAAAGVAIITGREADSTTAERLTAFLQLAWEQLVGLLV